MNDDAQMIWEAYLQTLRESNVGKEHERLADVLIQVGKNYGYTIHNTLPSQIKSDTPNILQNRNYPDVTGQTFFGNRIFIADAKDANNNDTPSNKETYKRIDSYLKEFATKTQSPSSSGDIAIATNNYSAALEWKNCLEELCEKYNILQRLTGAKAKFYVTTIDLSTYIISNRA